MSGLQIIPSTLLLPFEKKVKATVKKCFQQLSEQDFSVADFKNYMTAGAVASSQIEGNSLDLNSYYQSRENKKNTKEVIEIENLLVAYEYAKSHKLTQKALLKCHKTLSSTFTNITQKQKGNYRHTRVGISGWSGLLYMAIEPEKVAHEMDKLFADIAFLSEQPLTLKQTLFYAASIHFMFAKIHPFADGNGRAARLLEKWFLAENLGIAAWGIPTEKFYFDHRHLYYEGLNIGANYYDTLENLHLMLPFLNLLPQAVCYKPAAF